jgi:hypothetical protein
MLWLALLAQAMPPPATEAPPPPPTTLQLLAKPDCSPTDNDVVVCGHPDDQRIRPLAPPPAPAGPPDGPLSFRLPGGGSGKLRAITSELPGARGSGAAVTVKIPF